jgi:3-hydroxyacyl-CoA dehydrogenase
LDVDVIGEASGRPEKVLGTHFFSPANVMPLLENIRGKKSSEATIATAMKMGKTIGKTTVLTGNCFGFIGNRMFEPYTQQATCLVEEGATPAQVDRALGPQGFGFAMGPLAVFDLAGIDIGTKIRSEDYYPHKPSMVVPNVHTVKPAV